MTQKKPLAGLVIASLLTFIKIPNVIVAHLSSNKTVLKTESAGRLCGS